jgi:hypothetical protein
MPKKYAKHGRRNRKPSARQQKFVKALAEGKTLTQAAKEANYSSKNPGQSGYQALAQLRGREVATPILDEIGMHDQHILAVMQSTCSALCWILGHKQGELFMTRMALLETALKKLGYEEVTIH